MSRQNGLVPEERLLLLLAQGRLPFELQDTARCLLGQQLSWSLILEQARAQGVFPLLYWNLSQLGFPGVPEEARMTLAALYKTNAIRNSLLTRELVRVLRAFGEAGIPAIPLKGVALAKSLYGDPTLRVCSDIDIMVPRSTVTQALHLLLSKGYRTEFTERFFEDLLLRSDIEYTLVREDRYILDLQWGILWGASLDGNAPEDLWAEARAKAIFGVPAYALSPEWEFLYLAAHAARHRWQELRWLIDIHEVCSSRQIDWEWIRKKAAALGWEELVGLTLSVCHSLLDTPTPANFSPIALPRWLKLFPASSPDSNAVFDRARLLRRPSDKFRYLLRVLLVPTLAERRLLSLPSSLGFLYYVVRPVRLACKWSWRLGCPGVQGQAAAGA